MYLHSIKNNEIFCSSHLKASLHSNHTKIRFDQNLAFVRQAQLLEDSAGYFLKLSSFILTLSLAALIQ